MSSQNTTLRKIVILVLTVAVLAAGAAWYVQTEVEKRVRTSAETFIRDTGGVPTLGQISYNLISNTLEIKDIKVTMHQQGQPVSYAIARVTLKKPNRSLIVALATNGITDQKGILTAVEELTVENYVADIAPAPGDAMQIGASIKVPMQVVRSITVDMDTLVPVLTRADRTEIDTIVAIAQSCAYASRTVPGGMTADITGKDVKGTLTAKNMEEVNFGRCMLERGSITGLAMDLTAPQQEKVSIALQEMSMAHVYIAPEALRQSLEVQKNPTADPSALLKAIFAGERPFLGSLTMKGLTGTGGGADFSMGLLEFTNSSTKPFAASLKLEKLPLDLSLIPDEGAMIAQLLGKSKVMTSVDMSALVPVDDPKGLAKFALSLKADDLVATSLQTEGLITGTVNWSDPNVMEKLFDENYLLKSFTVSLTDQGLAAMAMKLASGSMGLAPEAIAPLMETMVQSELNGQKISAANMQAIKDFITHPGTITFTFTPATPTLFVPAMEQLDLDSASATIQTVKSEKSLSEQAKATK